MNDTIRQMQSLTQRTWGLQSRWHIGDLAWDWHQHLGREWPTSLWENAWGWADLPGDLDLLVHPDHPQLADEVLEWFHGIAGAQRSVTILDKERHLAEALSRHGYERASNLPFMLHMSRDLSDLPEPVLPRGFVARSLRDEDLAGRVAAHRAAFHPSKVTEDSYRNVMRAWPYQQELDCVVESPDGEIVAYALVWLDAQNGVGEFEPTGTRPEYQRLGLARAVCLFALRQLNAMGANTAIVCARGDAAYPVPTKMYRSLGFREHARSETWTSM